MATEMAISDADLEDIKKRYQQTTPGPWTSIVEGRDQLGGSDFIQTAGEDIYLRCATTADQDFIAHARQDIPRLVEEVLRLRAIVAERSS